MSGDMTRARSPCPVAGALRRSAGPSSRSRPRRVRAALRLAACAPPPYRDEAAAGYDATWRALIRALAGENVPLRVVAKDSGVISSDDFISPIGVYADCGRLGEVPLEGEALVAFTLFVQPGGTAATRSRSTPRCDTHAYRRGRLGKLKSDPVFQCVSTGRWEANLLDSVRRLVKE